MYTKEQLLNAKEILLNLICDDRELTFRSCGICFNLNQKLNGIVDGYSIVNDFGHTWQYNGFDQTNEEDKGYVLVKRDYGYGLWEGPNLSLRIDLMKYIVGKIDEMLGDTL